MINQLRILFMGCLGGFVGWLIGQVSPGGIAALSEPGSAMRHQASILYGAVGLVLGMILACMIISSSKK